MSTKGAKGAGEILLYQTDDGQTTLDVRLEAETLWLSLNQMADLFLRDKSVISRHLGNIFRTSELNRESTHLKSGICFAGHDISQTPLNIGSNSHG